MSAGNTGDERDFDAIDHALTFNGYACGDRVDLAAVLEPWVAQWRADAWDEGHRHSCEYTEDLCRLAGDLDANPYRANPSAAS